MPETAVATMNRAVLRRLSQEEYLYFPLTNDVKIPDHFFRRIGCMRDTARAAEESQKRQKACDPLGSQAFSWSC